MIEPNIGRIMSNITSIAYPAATEPMWSSPAPIQTEQAVISKIEVINLKVLLIKFREIYGKNECHITAR
jgi:hypothetical protein